MSRSCSLALLLLAADASALSAQAEFPYERDLVLDTRPMRGSKRVPVLSVESGGRVQIDLWCKRGEGHAAMAGDAFTLTIGAMKDEPCTPERAQADEDLLAALSQVAGWSQRGDTVTLLGVKSLRFRLATH